MNFQVIKNDSDFDALRDQWDRLFEGAVRKSPPLRFDWMRTWWHIYGPIYGRELCIVTFRSGPDLVGLLPLYYSDRGSAILPMSRLGFLSTGEDESEEICADYLDLLALPEHEQACITDLRKHLRDFAFDEFNLLDIAENSPLTKLSGEVNPRGQCPIADLTGGFEAYLSRLSSNGRQQARRLLRAADKAGATFEIATTRAQAIEFFEQMIPIHQARWAGERKPGVFGAERFTQFHRALVEQWIEPGYAMISRLSLNGSPLAIKYGFLTKGKYDFYQSGVVHDDSAIKSAGIVSFLKLMSHLADNNVTTFDFLRGDSGYKARLATTARNLVELKLQRATLRSGAFKIHDLARRASNKARKLIGAVP